MAIKIDLAKAYHMLNWQFLDNVLIETSMPRSFIALIIRSSHFNAVWNGGHSDSFSTSRGVR